MIAKEAIADQQEAAAQNKAHHGGHHGRGLESLQMAYQEVAKDFELISADLFRATILSYLIFTFVLKFCQTMLHNFLNKT